MPFAVMMGIEHGSHADAAGLTVVGGGQPGKTDGLVAFKGEVFDREPATIELLLKDHGVPALASLEGEFCGVYVDQASGTITFFTDRAGREVLFYFWDGRRLVVSDDFWTVVHVIGPSDSLIDAQSVKEFALLHYPLEFRTIVRNLNFVPPSTAFELSADRRQLSSTCYWDFRYDPDPQLTIEAAVAQVDATLMTAFNKIRQKCGDVLYGVGLSGGLDSRVLPHYAAKNSMRLQSFIIGESHPRGLFVSRDHRNARDLARHFGLNHVEVEWDAESFIDKLHYDLQLPAHGTQFFIALQRSIPEFDVLLTGATGIVVGAELPSDIECQSREQLARTLLTQFSYLSRQATGNKLKRVTQELFGTKASGLMTEAKPLPGLLSSDEFEIIKGKIEAFVQGRSDKTTLDIFQEYFMFHMASRNKNGAYESLMGRQKCYSIYTPFLLDLSLRWKPEFLKDRRILKELIRRILPDLARIKGQDFKVSLADEGQASVVQKGLALAEFAIRGNGVGRYRQWAGRRKYIDFSRGILTRPNRVFDEIFDRQAVLETLYSNVRLYDQLVKIKAVLDLLESGEYRQYLPKEIAL